MTNDDAALQLFADDLWMPVVVDTPPEQRAARLCVEDAGTTAEDFCVYRNIIDHSAAEKTVVVTDVRAELACLLTSTRHHREAV